MRSITVCRPQKMQFPLMKGKILIDGNECAQIKAGKEISFEIPDGVHDIQVIFASAPPTQSNILPIAESDGELGFEVKILVPLKGGETTAELTRK